MGKKYLLTIAIPSYRPSVENVELSSPVQHNASPDKNSRTNVTVSFLDVTGIKPGPDLSNQKALRIASGTEPTLIRKEDTTPLISCPVLCLSASLDVFILNKIPYLWIRPLGFIIAFCCIFIAIFVTDWKTDVIPPDSKCLSPVTRFWTKKDIKCQNNTDDLN
ncbi:uncharacterized protein TNCV_2680481 [Trichonephila clavipes]|uniref:Uncharacterized protein n=1 Tax=Trichonephila clavipes TaxID=2585209 RepID=A0A8X6S7U2_TRICX|nr:uncharacterized protein TNCV_2680481 [Trichonephila clavipes]